MTRKSFSHPRHPPLNDFIKEILANQEYGIISYKDGVALFKKGAPYREGIRILAYSSTHKWTIPLKKKLGYGIMLHGYNSPRMVGYGKDSFIHITVFWSTSEIISQDIGFLVGIKHNDKQYVITHRPIFGLFPTNQWEPGKIIKDEVFFTWREGVQPKEIWLSFSVADSDPVQ